MYKYSITNHTQPAEDHWKIQGGGDSLTFLEAKYEAKLEFPGGGGGVQNRKPPVGEYGYFLELCNRFGINKQILLTRTLPELHQQ